MSGIYCRLSPMWMEYYPSETGRCLLSSLETECIGGRPSPAPLVSSHGEVPDRAEGEGFTALPSRFFLATNYTKEHEFFSAPCSCLFAALSSRIFSH
jgi:hypothetical protein